MKNLPSKPPHLSEKPKGNGFRAAIFFVLGSMAVSGVGGFLIGKLSGDKSNKPDITDTRKSQDQIPTPPANPPLRSEDGDYLDFSQCRNLIITVGNPQCRKLSEEELKRRYLAHHKSELEKKANALIGRLGIHDSDDINKIYKAMLNGCTAVKSIAGKVIELKPPPAINNCDNPISLNQEPDKNLVDEGDFMDYEKMLSGLSADERAMMEAYRNKNYDELFRRANFNDIKSQVDLLDKSDHDFNKSGLGKSFSDTFKSLEDARDKILKTNDTNERQRIICELMAKWKNQQLTDEQSKKLRELQEKGTNLDFDDSVQFYTFWRGLLAMSGFTPSEFGPEEECK